MSPAGSSNHDGSEETAGLRQRIERLLTEVSALKGAQLGAVIDATPLPALATDAGKQAILVWSRRALSHFGYAPATVAAWHAVAFPNPEYRSEAIQRLDHGLALAAQSSEAIPAGTYEVTCGDGSTRVCNVHIAHVAGAFVVTFDDVTERHRFEAALRESEARFRHLFEFSLVAMSLTSPDGGVRLNRAFGEMLGYSYDELAGLTWRRVTHPEDAEQSGSEFVAVVSGRQPSARFEKRYLKRDGSVIWAELRSYPRRDDQGKILYLVTSVIDVTERKRAEAVLLASERKLKQAQRLARVGNWDWDLATNEVVWSDELFRIKRREPEAGALDLLAAEQPYSPESHARLVTAVRETMRTGCPFELELLSQFAADDHITTRIVGEVDRDATGGIARLRGIEQDISERKSTESNIQRINAFLDSVIENIPIMLFLLNARDLTCVRINRAGELLLGISRAEIIGRATSEFFPRDQALEFTHKDREVLAGGVPVEFTEETLQTRDKGARTVHTKMVPILDAHGRPEYLLGICEDITERKRAEQRQIETLNELRRWHEVTLGRETRILELKQEVNLLLTRLGEPIRYSKAEGHEGS